VESLQTNAHTIVLAMVINLALHRQGHSGVTDENPVSTKQQKLKESKRPTPSSFPR